MIQKVMMLLSVFTLLACESSKKVDEQCDEGGTLEGTKWCDGTSLTNDYKILGDVSKKKANCVPGQPASFTATEKETILKNVIPLSSMDAALFSILYGVCFERTGPNNGPPYEPSLEVLKPFVLAQMNARWSGNVVEFKRYYPNCNADFYLWPHPIPDSKFSYTPGNCTPDEVTGGTPRVPSGVIVATPYVHFEAFYSQSEFNSGSAGNLNFPNAISAKTSMTLAARMLRGIAINHNIPSENVKQSIHLETEAQYTDWKHRALPATNYWSKSTSYRHNLEAPLVITAFSTIINGNGTSPTKILTKFMTEDSVDVSGVFANNKLFLMRQGELEFILHHRNNLASNWTGESIRNSQIHFNLLYSDRLVTFIHLFIRQEFSGANPQEVFCNCVGVECFEDIAYTSSCSVTGERKFVPKTEEEAYLEYVLASTNYDGSLPVPGGRAKAGNKELKEELPSYINHTVGYTSTGRGKENNSFYVFFDKSKWPKVLGASPFLSKAETLQQKTVAHEIGHHIFGAPHAVSIEHVMYSFIDFDYAVPSLELPFKNTESATVSSFNLTQNIWGQPQ